MLSVLSWPPPFTVRKHPRSRSIRLKLCPQRGLQLVVPPHFPVNTALSVVNRHRAWIEKTWAQVTSQQGTYGDFSDLSHLSLLAIDETWQLVHEVSASTLKEVTKASGAITQVDTHALSLRGPSLAAKKKLQRWLHVYAEKHLLARLALLSQRVNLPYASASVRMAKTRWGSCSSQKKIMLNVKLLFLPRELVDYVLLHELCHTVHMNHAPSFWQLLAQVNPACQTLRKQLNQANTYIPSLLY